MDDNSGVKPRAVEGPPRRTRTCALSEAAYRKLRAVYAHGRVGDEPIEVPIGPDISMRLSCRALHGRDEFALEIRMPEAPSLIDVLFDGEWREIPEDLARIDFSPDGNAARLDRLREAVERVEPIYRRLAHAGYATVGFASNTDVSDVAGHLEPYVSIAEATGPCDLLEVVDRVACETARQVHQSFEWQAWSRLRGHPRRGPAGDGYSFFRLNDRVVGAFRMPSFRDDDQVFYLSTGRQAPWYVIRHPDAVGPQHALARAVRAVAAAKAQAAGIICVHASAFVTDAGAFMLCGDEGAGKTTNLLTALSVLGARFLSNDRVFIRAEHGRAMAYGYPHSIPVRAGTSRADGQLERRLARSPGTPPSRASVFDHVARDRESSDSVVAGEASRFFTALELSSQFGTSVCTAAPLAGIIVLDGDRAATAPTWVRRRTGRPADHLARHLHQHFCNAQTFWTELLDSGRPAIPPVVADALAETPILSLNSWHRLPEAWQEFRNSRRK